MDDRRASTRLLSCIPAQFESKGDTEDLALIRDISTTGARLYTRVRVDLNEPLTLHLYLGPEAEEPRKASGRVVRAEHRDPRVSDVWRWDIGVVFDEAITAYEPEIQALCDRQAAAGVLKR